MRFVKKHQYFLIICGLILISAFIFYLFSFGFDFSNGRQPVWGVTFSEKYAKDLQLDWQSAYLAILDDLNVRSIRLIAYWDDIEKQPGVFDFTDLDWQILQAQQRGADITLIVGRRTPRWPECHDPAWLAALNSYNAVENSQLEFVRQTINRYKNVPEISVWQVENEPFLSVFGQCPEPDGNFLQAEINLARSLDQRPILITDSGELSTWQPAAGYPDIFGTTLYRIVWNKYFGFFDYFLIPPAYYRLKADATRLLHPNLKEMIISELQMEPWALGKPMVQMSLADQQKSFNLSRFESNISYAKKIGFNRVYFWGVEYWYWLKQQGRPEIWQAAKSLWQ